MKWFHKSVLVFFAFLAFKLCHYSELRCFREFLPEPFPLVFTLLCSSFKIFIQTFLCSSMDYGPVPVNDYLFA